MSKKHANPNQKLLAEIADSTLAALDRGSYIVQDIGEIFLSESISRCIENTRLYPSDSILANWATRPASALSSTSLARIPYTNTNANLNSNSNSGRASASVTSSPREKEVKIIILQTSTLAGARLLANTTARDLGAKYIETEREDNKIGILNFASAKHPGGGFITGAQAQEESLARSSTLYPSLVCSTSEPFYQLHRHDPQAGYYSHSMIYSPNVLLMRDDDGNWQRPIAVDTVSSPAVNAKVVRQSLMGRLASKSESAKIERTMRERAARILYAFERHGVRNLVLGAWGCGVFGNDVRMVAFIWADLLGREEARFRRSFERVVFAVVGQERFREFEAAFEVRSQGDGRKTHVESTVSLDGI